MLLFYVLLFILSSAISIATQEYIDNKYQKKMRLVEQLPDIRDKLPYLYNLHLKKLIDLWSSFIFSYTLVVVSYGDKLNLLSTWSILSIIRSWCFSITILPPPSPCHNYIRFTGGSCDAIFSGHTMMSVLSSIIIIEHYNNYIISISLILISILYTLSILITRGHYSVDILLAYILTISIYYNNKNVFILGF